MAKKSLAQTVTQSSTRRRQALAGSGYYEFSRQKLDGSFAKPTKNGPQYQYNQGLRELEQIKKSEETLTVRKMTPEERKRFLS